MPIIRIEHVLNGGGIQTAVLDEVDYATALAESQIIPSLLEGRTEGRIVFTIDVEE